MIATETGNSQNRKLARIRALIAVAILLPIASPHETRADHICSDVAVSDKIEIKNDGILDAISGTAILSTNSTSNSKIKIKNDAVATADLYVGNGGSTSSGISIENSGVHNGSQGVLDESASIVSPSVPNPACGSSSGGNCSLCGELKYDDETVTISSDMRLCKFEAKGDSVISISGDVTIVTDDEFKVTDDAQIVLLADATLTIYVTDSKFKIEEDARFNVNTADPSRATVYLLANDNAEIMDNAIAYATVSAPNADLKIQDNSEFYGSYRGENLKIEDDGQFHVESNPCTQSIDHFEISHDGTALNCQAESIAVSAHDSSHTVVTSYQSTISLSTSTAHGDWSLVSGGGPVTNSGSGSATYVFASGDNGVVTLGLRDTFAESVNINVAGSGGEEHASEDNSLTFATSGFLFAADGTQSSIGTQIGGKSSSIAPGAQSLELQAVRTSDSTGSCESFLTGTVTVGLAFECKSPTSCTSNLVNIEGASVNGNNLGTSLSYENVNLDFGDTSDTTASFVMSYLDVGKIQLHARLTLSPSGETLNGASNEFVVRPFGFDIGAAGNTAPANELGDVFTSAGADFTTSARAVLWSAADDTNNDGIADGHNDTNPTNNADLTNNTSALNFGQGSEDVALGATLYLPASGNDPGLAGGTTIGSFVSGSGSSSTASYHEVGIVELSSSISDSDYQAIGTSETAKILGRSGTVGRFIPADFEVTYNTSRFQSGCDVGLFTYQGQAFGYHTAPVITVTATTSAGVTTQNYTGVWWKFNNASLAGRTYTAATGTLDVSGLPNTSSDPTVFDGGGGSGTLTFGAGSGLLFTRTATANAPFDADISLAITITDLDGVGYSSNPAQFGTASSGSGMAFSGAKEIRYGRLALANAHGSELVNLAVPLFAEYFDGSSFRFNDRDQCTVVSAAHVQLVKDPLGIASTPAINNSPLLLGDADLRLSLAGDGFPGIVEIEVDLSAATGADLEWLRFDWPADGDSGALPTENPTSRATFGIYRGRDSIIYMRESY